MSVTTTPYGEWSSPITGDSFTARFVTLSQVRVDGSDTYWVEGHPKEDGRGTLLRRRGTGETLEILPLIDSVRLPDVRTRVHEYGGKAYAVADGTIVFSDGFDNRVYRFDVNDTVRGIVPLTTLSKVRFGDFHIDEVRGLVYAVAEDHTDPSDIRNSLVAIPLDGSAGRNDSALVTVFDSSDFVSSPAISPDGTRLAWLSWNHPNMPWTQSTLHVASLDFEGHINHSCTIVDSPEVCVYEPRWTLDGDLIHVDDSTGWANLFRTEGFEWREGEDEDAWISRLRTRALHPGTQAFSHPHWRLGLHSFDNFDHDHLICSWAEQLTWHIGTVRLDNGMAEEWATGWWPIGNVASCEDRVVFLGDSAMHSPSIVEVKNGKTSIIRPSTEAEVPAELISTAEVMSWKTRDGEKSYGFYYAPRNPDFVAPTGDLPPLIVNVHSGPTFSSRPGLKVPFQYWTSRGFAVLDVNFRGSTGFGRAYRERLNGHWGQMDVQDCIDGAQYLIDRGLVDPQRIAIRGASAGGFTALNALASSDVFSAGTVFYAMTDLRRQAADTHKFERHYYSRLLGSDNVDDAVWADRSPINHIDSIKAPLFIMHGTNDHVVPVSQAQAMHDALVKRGNAVALKIYEGEGHSFHKADNIRDAWQSELAFYRQVWGMNTDNPTRFEIVNL
ncbi:S9 family peptidase [Schaalia sp. ZJ405]|uniref:alpha/beta hydrolase family protein n=1 Tax=Schaalia sp. ZJ405 TaxID=2709403 RepID=UPI0013EA1975|nr:prolyl oligopeptidase family serine peptidase [Schaalia sp. ZJ405]QPK80547.1 S9 family peptidase [Schaalia sp. ZJ405]